MKYLLFFAGFLLVLAPFAALFVPFSLWMGALALMGCWFINEAVDMHQREQPEEEDDTDGST